MAGAIVSGGCTQEFAKPEDLPSCVVPVGDSPTRGPPDAWVTIVEFGDFQCSFCAIAEHTVKELDVERPGLRWVWKHLPITSIHARALPTAIAAECAGVQGHFWEMHDLLYQNQDAQSDQALAGYAQQIGLDMTQWQACLTSGSALDRFTSDEADAAQARVNATPSFFINGKSLVGAHPLGDFISVVDAAHLAASTSGATQLSYYSEHEGEGCL